MGATGEDWTEDPKTIFMSTPNANTIYVYTIIDIAYLLHLVSIDAMMTKLKCFATTTLAVVVITTWANGAHSFPSSPVPIRIIPKRKADTFYLHTVPPRRVYQGVPSSPGWKQGKLDELTDWAVNDAANRPVICEYESDSFWLWTKWRGTVLSMVIVPLLLNLSFSVGVDLGVHHFSESSWTFLQKPPPDDPLIQQLQGFHSLWEYQVTLCTFILTFFTAEAYKHWRSVYFTTRAIQGRINDVCLLLTVGSKQRNNNNNNDDLLVTCTRLIKLSHTFFWAATPTCSNGVGDGGIKDGDDNPDIPYQDNAIGPLLLSHDGLEGLVDAGELTNEEAEALLHSGLPPSQYSYVLLEWVGLYAMDGLESGELGSTTTNSGLEENLLRQLTMLRAEYFSIGDYSAGRMPLAYVQLVQILVDSLVFLAPLSLYSEIGTLSIPLTGLLTLFFKGLLELSKSFLDPFGNEGFPGQNIRVDVLVSELNFGAASRWIKAAESFPAAPNSPRRSTMDTTKERAF